MGTTTHFADELKEELEDDNRIKSVDIIQNVVNEESHRQSETVNLKITVTEEVIEDVFDEKKAHSQSDTHDILVTWLQDEKHMENIDTWVNTMSLPAGEITGVVHNFW